MVGATPTRFQSSATMFVWHVRDIYRVISWLWKPTEKKKNMLKLVKSIVQKAWWFCDWKRHDFSILSISARLRNATFFRACFFFPFGSPQFTLKSFKEEDFLYLYIRQNNFQTNKTLKAFQIRDWKLAVGPIFQPNQSILLGK